MDQIEGKSAGFVIHFDLFLAGMILAYFVLLEEKVTAN